MATPHVAGAISIIHQYLALTGRTKTPSEIEDILAGTGKNITDSQNASQNFSRIDIYSAIISLDEDAPNVTLVSPANGSLFVSNQNFTCNASDLSLKNVTFYLWNSTSLYNQTSSAVSGATNTFQVNLTNMPAGSYTWTCTYYDESDNPTTAANFTIINRKQVIIIGVDGLHNGRFNALLNSGSLGNFSRLIGGAGWNTTANITGHTTTETAPGNAELFTGLNSTLNNVSVNWGAVNGTVPDGKTVYERLEAFDSNIVTGFVYGKYRTYIPLGIFTNALADINVQHYNFNRTYTYDNTNWKYETFTSGVAYSENVSTQASDFINTYVNDSFFLVVYFGVPDAAGHNQTDDSAMYNASIINVDAGIGLLLDNLEANGLRGSENVTQIILTADHGWTTGDDGHSVYSASTSTLPLLTNNKSLVWNATDVDGREQCDVTPTILDYFGVSASSYTDITGNGCSSMIGDLISPAITINNPATSLSSTSVTLGVTINEVGVCEYSLDAGVTNVSMSSSDNLIFTASAVGVEGSNSVIYFCNDSLGNSNSSSRSFNIDTSVPPSSGGGGGGSTTSTVITLTNTEFSSGTNKELASGGEIKFSSSGSSHSLKINKIGTDYANITLQSEPINLLLYVGQEAKKDLNNDGIFEIYVKLNSILNSKVNLTIRAINEVTNKTGADSNNLNDLGNGSESVENKIIDAVFNPKTRWQKLYIPLIVLVILVLAVIYYFESRKLHKKYRRHALELKKKLEK